MLLFAKRRVALLLASAVLLTLPACRNFWGRVDDSSPLDPYTDGEMAGVALVANNVEIAYASLAPARALDPDVKAYADRMRTDHSSLNATLTELLARLDVAAHDVPLGTALRDTSAARRLRLRAMTGRAFDTAYVDEDVRSHQALLATIDALLARNAARREVREYVASLRPVVSAHLAHAEQLRATLAARRQ